MLTPEHGSSRLVLALGSFDGVHLGHQAIVRHTIGRALALGGSPALLTFDPLPAQLICPDFTYILTPLAEKVRLLTELGMELVVVVRFDERLQATAAEDFINNYILTPWHPAAVVSGADHRFGSRARGDVELLRRRLEPEGVRVEVVPEKRHRGAPVRSTRIREHLLLGHVRLAAELLGRPYTLSGIIIPGTGTGRKLGFPTINIQPGEPEKLVPADGVYAVRVEITAGGSRPAGGPQLHPAVLNIGHRPTFQGEQRSIEAHLLEPGPELPRPGASVTVHFIDRIRPERRFPSPEALADRIREDVACGRRMLESSGPRTLDNHDPADE